MAMQVSCEGTAAQQAAAVNTAARAGLFNNAGLDSYTPFKNPPGSGKGLLGDVPPPINNPAAMSFMKTLEAVASQRLGGQNQNFLSAVMNNVNCTGIIQKKSSLLGKSPSLPSQSGGVDCQQGQDFRQMINEIMGVGFGQLAGTVGAYSSSASNMVASVGDYSGGMGLLGGASAVAGVGGDVGLVEDKSSSAAVVQAVGGIGDLSYMGAYGGLMAGNIGTAGNIGLGVDGRTVGGYTDGSTGTGGYPGDGSLNSVVGGGFGTDPGVTMGTAHINRYGGLQSSGGALGLMGQQGGGQVDWSDSTAGHSAVARSLATDSYQCSGNYGSGYTVCADFQFFLCSSCKLLLDWMFFVLRRCVG